MSLFSFKYVHKWKKIQQLKLIAWMKDKIKQNKITCAFIEMNKKRIPYFHD